MQKEWFGSWFDSEYYHLLYKNRNEAEAATFITNIVSHLQLPAGAAIVDVACGKGRHCVQLHKLGFDVTGIDLSANSIAYAQQFATKGLQFLQQDMRRVFCSNCFDAVLNCFTSFGYFSQLHHNQLAAATLVAAAKKGAFIVVDFINVVPAIAKIGAGTHQIIKEAEATFTVTKKVINGIIQKNIEVQTATGEMLHFEENVQAITQLQLQSFFIEAGAEVVSIFGNYELGNFEENTSPRLILVLKKK